MGWDEWGRGEPRDAWSENGKAKRAAGFRNRNSARLLQRQRAKEGKRRQAEGAFLWGDEHDNTNGTVQPQHLHM